MLLKPRSKKQASTTLSRKNSRNGRKMKKVKSLKDLQRLMEDLGAVKEVESDFTSWTVECGPSSKPPSRKTATIKKDNKL